MQDAPAWEGPSEQNPVAPAPSDPDSLSVLSGTRRLSWQGDRVVLVGDSATQAWMETGLDFDRDAWLDSLARRGVNAVLVWTYIGSSPEHRRNDTRIRYEAPTMWPWCGSAAERNLDLSCFNETYFRRLRELVAAADARGIVVVLTVHDGWSKERFEVHPFNSDLGNGPLERRDQYVELSSYGREMPLKFDPDWDRAQRNQYFQERFCERLIDALQGYGNVVYEMFNEGEWYPSRQRLLHERHFLQFFRERTSALLASNIDHIDGGSDLRRDARLDVISLHRPRWDEETSARDAFDHYARASLAEPQKPVFFTETVPAWDGAPDKLDALMRLMWGALLGGAHVFVQDDTSFRFAARPNKPSNAAGGDRLLDRLGYASRFAAETGLATMKPAPGACSTGVCAVAPGSEYVVYAEEAEELWVDLSEVAADAMQVDWYDPRTGQDLAGGIVETADQARFVPPFTDAVLHLAVSL